MHFHEYVLSIRFLYRNQYLGTQPVWKKGSSKLFDLGCSPTIGERHAIIEISVSNFQTKMVVMTMIMIIVVCYSTWRQRGGGWAGGLPCPGRPNRHTHRHLETHTHTRSLASRPVGRQLQKQVVEHEFELCLNFFSHRPSKIYPVARRTIVNTRTSSNNR